MSSPHPILTVGLIGTGDMARFYAQTIQRHLPWVRLAAVSSQKLERAQALANAYAIPNAYGCHEAIFQTRLDAVMIVSASDTHAALIEHAAHHKVDAFCDKPLGVSLEAIDAALAKVAKSGIRLATGFNRRFDPAFQRLHHEVLEGSLGTPETLVIISRDPCFPTPQELATPHRLLIGSAIHDLDMARFLMQDDVVSISAQGSWLSPLPAANEQIDGSVLALRFRRGGLATIINSYRSTEGYDQRVELFGSKGVGRVDNVADARPNVSGDAPFFVKRYAVSYAQELRCFFGILRDGTWNPMMATGTDGRFASQLAEAAVQSFQRHAAIAL